MDAMRASPAPVARPVVLIAGWRAPSGSVSILADRLRDLTGSQDADFLVLAHPLGSDLDSIAAHVAEEIHAAFPDPADPARTAEVDVIGISMGGLIGRLVCLPPEQRGKTAGSPRVRVRSLYTIASPHGGTRLPRWLAPDAAARAMRPGSPELAELDAALTDDDATNNPARIVPYAVLNDTWVGATRAAPPGQQPVWVPGRVTLSHHLASLDLRITADIARRLREEQPLGEPSAPPRD
jgi:hypothetical protein